MYTRFDPSLFWPCAVVTDRPNEFKNLRELNQPCFNLSKLSGLPMRCGRPTPCALLGSNVAVLKDSRMNARVHPCYGAKRDHRGSRESSIWSLAGFLVSVAFSTRRTSLHFVYPIHLRALLP